MHRRTPRWLFSCALLAEIEVAFSGGKLTMVGWWTAKVVLTYFTQDSRLEELLGVRLISARQYLDAYLDYI